MAELTPRAGKKLAQLLATAQDAEAFSLALLPKRQKLEEAVAIAERQAQALPEDDAAAQIAEDLAHELAELGDEQVRRRQRHEFAMITFNRCREWGNLLPYRAQIIDIAAPKPDGADLALVRSTIAKAKEALALLRAAAPMADELEAMVKQYVERVGEKYRPRLTLTTGGGPMADFAYTDMLSPFGPFGLACWLTPDAVISRLTGDFAAQFGTGGMSAEKRKELERQIAEGMDALERQEEGLVEAGLEAGQDVARRYDASPAAVLAVTVANVAVAA
jgi:hypothetical protein